MRVLFPMRKNTSHTLYNFLLLQLVTVIPPTAVRYYDAMPWALGIALTCK